MRKLEVRPEGKKSYEILIGNDLYSDIESFVKQSGYSKKALIITDTNVGKLYANPLKETLLQAGLEPAVHQVKAGESSKSLETFNDVFTRCITEGLDRNSLIVALGGGVVGDLAGFIAASYMRGIPFIQVPTSLLAQVDSSVGGKVAVNHRLGKNLIGAFYQPQKVFIDLNSLSTLPKREIYTGIGEIVKYGIIYDEEFFSFLEKNTAEVMALKHEAIEHIVHRSCEIKADVVSQDETETGLRKILNFGHTFGHAVEKETGYVRYNHGEAVAIGMLVATDLSLELGLIDETVQKCVRNLIEAFNLPVEAEGCTAENLIKNIFHDKKTVNGVVSWVLIDKIGHTTIRKDVSLELAERVFDRFTAK